MSTSQLTAAEQTALNELRKNVSEISHYKSTTVLAHAISGHINDLSTDDIKVLKKEIAELHLFLSKQLLLAKLLPEPIL